MRKKWILLAAVFTVLAAAPAYAGQWIQDDVGWWWQDDDGSYPANWSRWLDGNRDGIYELYYFDESGYLYTNTSLFDGMVTVDENGASVKGGTVMTMAYDPDENMGKYFEKTAETAEESREELDPYELACRIIELVNEERETHGKEALDVNDELLENAMVRAEESGSGCAPHKRPDGSNYDSAIAAGYSKAAENLAYIGYMPNDTIESAAERIVYGWLGSSGHKKNMLRSQWEETGVGVYIDGTKIAVSQLFIKR
ncbi:CAP domain-containing protein [Lacrimispora sp. 210928-DFI.3.58]|uniref:CAP domain-containing protein n=1 Tax=Lacrimispora sp. 210928-DFI.3.58 TaxID=2883214 RepID=UPI001D099425|nr:CAP domain-containing protein [Lacrimispora sp. 210928-DFI.3.58]MCB7318464.1 CAP domain-containing protein [Lacrimispora sp. 210928-DFI.3.58]